MRKGPYPVVYDRTDIERLSSIEFGIIRPGVSSQEIAVWLWNKKNFIDAPTATGIRVTAVAVNNYGAAIVDNKYIGVKSCGIMDPDNVGIVDDDEDVFFPIGGDLTDENSYHRIGDIPSNCARRLYFRIDTPPNLELAGVPRIVVQVGFLSEEVKWLYASG